jgi:hypothetical protein
MKHPDVARLMASLYFDEPQARSVLIQSGFPHTMLPPFTHASAFWTTVVLNLEQGLGPDGTMAALIATTAGYHPGNPDVQAMHAKWSGATQVTTPSSSITSEGPCSTLTLIGADLPDQFLDVIRAQLSSDEPNLLYVSKQQCSVAIRDPGNNAARLQHQVREQPRRVQFIDRYAPATIRNEIHDFSPQSLYRRAPPYRPVQLCHIPSSNTARLAARNIPLAVTMTPVGLTICPSAMGV